MTTPESVNPYGPNPPAQPPTAPPPAPPVPLAVPRSTRGMAVHWIMFAFALAANTAIGVAAGLVAFSGFSIFLVFALIPALLLVGTVFQLLQLLRREPSLPLGVVMLLPSVVALGLQLLLLVSRETSGS